MSERLIGGRYELRRQIGVGGMATVYLGFDRHEGREVAVKVLDARYAADPAFVERFRREARAAASLDHPNVVRVHDWGEESESGTPLHYIVMEYVPGPNLKELLRERGPLPQSEALPIVVQIARALEAAHDQGIVHRDVKPQNVLLAPGDRVKVADFGIARAVGTSQLTSTTSVLGSVHYVAPEQVQGEPADARADIYSLGVLLYELLTDTLPFGGDTPVAVAMQHVQKPPPSPRLIQPGITPLVEAIVQRALAKDPSRRYQTAAEFRTAVESALRDLADSALAATQPLASTPAIRPPSTARMRPAAEAPPSQRPSFPPSLRWPGVALTAFAALILLLLLAGYPTSAQPTSATVPDVTGKTLSEARVLLERAGLRLEVRQRLHHAAPEGTVVAQEPFAGMIVLNGTAVAADISLGPALAPAATPTSEPPAAESAPRPPPPAAAPGGAQPNEKTRERLEEIAEQQKEAEKKAEEQQRETEKKAEEKQREAEKKRGR